MKEVFYIETDQDHALIFHEVASSIVKEKNLDINIRLFFTEIEMLSYIATEQQRPDLIVSAMDLAIIDGVQLKSLLEENSKFLDIPFCILTKYCKEDLAYKDISKVKKCYFKNLDYPEFNKQLDEMLTEVTNSRGFIMQSI